MLLALPPLLLLPLWSLVTGRAACAADNKGGGSEGTWVEGLLLAGGRWLAVENGERCIKVLTEVDALLTRAGFITTAGMPLRPEGKDGTARQLAALSLLGAAVGTLLATVAAVTLLTLPDKRLTSGVDTEGMKTPGVGLTWEPVVTVAVLQDVDTVGMPLLALLLAALLDGADVRMGLVLAPLLVLPPLWAWAWLQAGALLTTGAASAREVAGPLDLWAASSTSLTLAADDAMGGEGEEDAAWEAGEGEAAPPAAAAAEGTELLLLLGVDTLLSLGTVRGAGLALLTVLAAAQCFTPPDSCVGGLAEAAALLAVAVGWGKARAVVGKVFVPWLTNDATVLATDPAAVAMLETAAVDDTLATVMFVL